MTRPLCNAAESPYLVPYDGSLSHADCPTTPPDDVEDDKALKNRLIGQTRELDHLERMLYAQDKYAVLLVFQALDAAGKDSTIRQVFRRVDPVGLHVSSFKAPTKVELQHDFLWRSSLKLPERGSMAVFNRSYYEEVLVVRVHPEFLGGQNLPPHDSLDELWQHRYQSINEHEAHLARSGTLVIKFWLKHSYEEQRNRFLSRIDTPEKMWKFSERDVIERGYWDEYMKAYEDAVNATSRPHAPWYVIPADNKRYMRCTVADIVNRTLHGLNMSYPKLDAEKQAELKALREQLIND